VCSFRGAQLAMTFCEAFCASMICTFIVKQPSGAVERRGYHRALRRISHYFGNWAEAGA